MTDTTCLIDGIGPLTRVRPGSLPELQDAVRRAAADGVAVYPVGGGTQLDQGLPPARPGVALDTRGLAQVIDYPARDMTITVQAGITLGALHTLLAAEHQRLPIDVPQADRATLGGAIATNASGPRRLGFGTFRDYVIGISVVNDEGQETKAGGRVVKNVAGYDLCKLHVGALGTLGIITQVTLKLKPRPEEQALVLLGCGADGLDGLLDQLHGSRTRPVCLDVLNAAAARQLARQTGVALPETAWSVLVGFEDNHEAVAWQVQQLVKEMPAGVTHGLDALLGPTGEPLWRALGEHPSRPEAVLTFRANLLPRAVASFCREALRLTEQVHLQAHAGSGIVVGHVEGDLTEPQARSMLARLHELAAPAQGNVVVRRCPAAWKRTLPVWGLPRGDAWLMRAVKEKLDPRRLFNPGRFVDGI